MQPSHHLAEPLGGQSLQEQVADGGIDLEEAVADLAAEVGEEEIRLGGGRQSAFGMIEEEVGAQEVDEAGVERTPPGYTVVLRDDVVVVEIAETARGLRALLGRPAAGPLEVKAPMPGKVLRVLVEPGQETTPGQGVVVVEAMKMENELRAGRGGRVKDVLVREGQAVESGALLVVLE